VYNQIGKRGKKALLIAAWKKTSCRKAKEFFLERKKCKIFLIALSASAVKIVITAV